MIEAMVERYTAKEMAEMELILGAVDSESRLNTLEMMALRINNFYGKTLGMGPGLAFKDGKGYKCPDCSTSPFNLFSDLEFRKRYFRIEGGSWSEKSEKTGVVDRKKLPRLAYKLFAVHKNHGKEGGVKKIYRKILGYMGLKSSCNIKEWQVVGVPNRITYYERM